MSVIVEVHNVEEAKRALKFKARLKGEIQSDSFDQIDHLEKRALLNDDMDNS